MAPTSHSAESYDAWSREELVERIRQLEAQTTPHPRPHPPKKQQQPFDFSKHPKRKIALRFCYSGAEYSGLEFQKLPTSLPTVEGVLFDALAHVKFIDPKGGLEGCGWEKCGRTDRGVSAAGNVISLWVRSAIGDILEPPPVDESPADGETHTKTATPEEEFAQSEENDVDGLMMMDWDEKPMNTSAATAQALAIHRPPQELKYLFHLNNNLPPSIRIIAWAPVSETFSARFNCRYRHYKYFFLSDGLDVETMQDGADRLVGEHDYRNLCKLDVSKQLTTFKRKILSAKISPVDHQGNLNVGGESHHSPASSSKLYVFDLIGTAFLYNQVRHIMAILFLVGTKLESPQLVSALLNVDPSNPYPPFREGEDPPPVVESKPEYQMADALPLVLWDTGYSDEDVKWRSDREVDEDDEEQGQEEIAATQRDLSGNLYSNLHTTYSRSLIHTTLDYHFILSATRNNIHRPPPPYLPIGAPQTVNRPEGSVLSLPLGGGMYRRLGNYVKVLERKRADTVDVINERWKNGKGKRRMERKAGVITNEDIDE